MEKLNIVGCSHPSINNTEGIRKNPFIRKNPEGLTPSEARALFATPPGFNNYEDISKHHIIVGSMGSGKSILLKALSVQAQSLNTTLDKMPYCGIYIPRLIPINKFLDQYEKFEKHDVFQHFFAILVVSEIAEQISGIVSKETDGICTEFIVKRLIKKLYLRDISENSYSSDDIPSINSLPSNIQEIAKFLKEKLQDVLNRGDRDLDLQPEKLGSPFFWTLDGLVQFLKDLHHEISPFPIFCLLIDAFEDFGSLGILLLKYLMKHENLGFLCVKVATRRFEFNIEELQREFKIEYERDFDITILDCDPNNPEHINDFLRRLANRKLRVEWMLTDEDLETTNINTLLSYPGPNETNWDSKITPGENFKVNGMLGTNEAQEKRRLRQKCFSGFDCIAKVSMVNPYEFLEICQIAYNEQERIDKTKISIQIPTPNVSSMAQSEALLKKSRMYRDIGITSKKEYKEIFLGIRSFIYNTANYLEDMQSPGQFEGARICIPLQDLQDAHMELIREGILSRDLFLPSKEKLIHLILDPKLLPAELELNRLICPIFGISWEYKGNIDLPFDKIDSFIKMQIHGDLDFTPHVHKPQQILKQGQLIGYAEPAVFISTRYSDDNKKRITKIKKSINSIRRDGIKPSGRLPIEDISMVTDLWEVRKKHGGNFKFYILDEIENSLYVVGDITGTGLIPTGVTYELGAAIGLKKPFFLYWDTDDSKKAFSSNIINEYEWHPFLRDQDVRVWESGKGCKTFKEWYQINIDQLGRKVSGKINCVLKGFPSEKRCSCEELIKKRINKPYLSFQTQNEDAKQVITDILSSKYGCYPIDEQDFPHTDPICFKCAAIQASSFQIIDVSARRKDEKGDPSFALELGFAYAIHRNSNSTIMASDADVQVNPVEMFPGFAWSWHKQKMSQNIRENLDNFMKNLGYGGMKK